MSTQLHTADGCADTTCAGAGLDDRASVAIDASQEGFQTVRLRSAGRLEAVLAPEVGMTCCSLLHDGEELLGRGLGLASYAHRGTSMGISLMHPWADRLSGWSYTACGQTVHLPISPLLHTDGSGLPVNGVQSCGSAWMVNDVDAGLTSAWLEATLPFDHDPRQLELFPFPHQVHIRMELDRDSLSIATIVEAKGEVPVPVCFGLRLYLQRVPPPRHCTMVLPERRRLEINDLLLPTGASEQADMDAFAVGVEELHEVFALERDRRVSIATDTRRLAIEAMRGFPLAEVRSRAGEPHVMLEALTAAPDALSHEDFPLALPGKPYEAALRLSAESL